MSYTEQNLGKNEQLVKKADRNGVALVGIWIPGILLCWLFFIPTIKAIFNTIRFFRVELAITNKRIVGRGGLGSTASLDAPLDKIQNVNVIQKLGGKIFNYGTVVIQTAAGTVSVPYIKNADAFKGQVMSQIDQAQEDRMMQQAQMMASAMAGAMHQ